MLLLLLLSRHRILEQSGGRTRIKNEDLARLAHCSTSAVRRSLARLRDAGRVVIIFESPNPLGFGTRPSGRVLWTAAAYKTSKAEAAAAKEMAAATEAAAQATASAEVAKAAVAAVAS